MDSKRLDEMKQEIKEEEARIRRRKEEEYKQRDLRIDEKLERWRRRNARLQPLLDYIRVFPDKIKPPKVAPIATIYRTLQAFFMRRKRQAVCRCPECGSVAATNRYDGGYIQDVPDSHYVWTHRHCICGWEYAERFIYPNGRGVCDD